MMYAVNRDTRIRRPKRYASKKHRFSTLTKCVYRRARRSCKVAKTFGPSPYKNLYLHDGRRTSWKISSVCREPHEARAPSGRTSPFAE
ncbi:hypothetical protein EVAR_64135_1 [Eumeta japonica]|uniref:Uncharacterized protein n=1 Tax=Eumeta variegata TaxID=151549 RepID=A0A4C2A454_EUMVA|nr:hypothetical protein EVAR_64135_1 [Eumeta japonica]